MPRNRLGDEQSGFAGGLNTQADESQLAENEIRRADNTRLTVFGAATKRGGTQRVHASALAAFPVRGGFSWEKIDGTVRQLAVCNGKVFQGTFSAIPMTWTDTTGTVSSSVQPSFADFANGGSQDVVYIADGGLLNSWDGTTYTADIAGTPSVKYLAQYNVRLFGAGDSANPQTIYWSAQNNGDTLGIGASSGGSAIIRTFSHQNITGLMPLGASLMIFHDTGISRFTGYAQDDIAINAGTQGVASDVGTIAPGSLVRVENVGFFLSDRGFYQVTEYGVSPISAKIDSVIASVNQSNFARVCSGHNKAQREVWFYLPDIGVYVYNYRLGAWSGPHTGIYTSQPTYSMWKTLDTNSNPIMLCGSADGFVREIDVANTNLDDIHSDGTGGTSFTFAVRCRRLYIGDSINEKALRFIYINADLKGSLTSALSWTTLNGTGQQTISQGTATSTWGTGTWGAGTWGGSGSTTIRVQANGRGQFVDVTISDDGNAQPSYTKVNVEGFNYGRRF